MFTFTFALGLSPLEVPESSVRDADGLVEDEGGRYEMLLQRFEQNEHTVRCQQDNRSITQRGR